MIDKSVSAKTALFPAKAGPTARAVSGMIVSTLCVGMHRVTLCVTSRGLNARRLQDAERPELRYHAERGNDHENTLIGDSGSDLDCGTGFSREAVDLLSLLICGARLICF